MISGLIVEILPFINFKISDFRIQVYGVLKTISPTIELSWLNLSFIVGHNFHSSLRYNFLNLSIYLLLGLGVFLYFKSKQKEVKLIRFFFGIVFISNVVLILTSLIALFIYFRFNGVLSLFLTVLNLGIRVSWVYFSYKILSSYYHLNNVNEIAKNEPHKLKITSKWQRLAHHLIDLVLSVSLMWLPFKFFVRAFELHGSIPDSQFFTYALLIVFRLFYFAIFETLFKSSPGKFLTESIVITNDGRLKLGKSLLRTLSRHVPFEPFSYLGKGDGWHDQWNGTRVVREQNLGYSPKWYLLIFPSALVIILSTYFISEKIDSMQAHAYFKTNHEYKTGFLDKKLNSLTTNDIIWIEKFDGYGGDETDYYLKVDEVTGDEVLCTAFQTRDYISTLLQIEDMYEYKSGINYQSVIVSIDSLLKGVQTDYDKYQNDEIGFYHPQLNERNRIKYISSIGGPRFEDGSSSSGGNFYSTALKNSGGKCNLIRVESLEGDLKLTSKLPLEMQASDIRYARSTRIEFEGYEYGDDFKVKLFFEDMNGRQYIYILNQMYGMTDLCEVFE